MSGAIIKTNMQTYYKETFEDFLQRMHSDDEPTVLDDDLPDAFDDWLSNLGVDLTIAYAEKWNVEQKLADLNEKQDATLLSNPN